MSKYVPITNIKPLQLTPEQLQRVKGYHAELAADAEYRASLKRPNPRFPLVLSEQEMDILLGACEHYITSIESANQKIEDGGLDEIEEDDDIINNRTLMIDTLLTLVYGDTLFDWLNRREE